MGDPRNAEYTQPITIHLPYSGGVFHLMIRPGTDTDSTFIAWHEDSQEFIRISGWMVGIERQGENTN